MEAYVLRWTLLTGVLAIVALTLGVSGAAGAASGVATFAGFLLVVVATLLLAVHFLRRV